MRYQHEAEAQHQSSQGPPLAGHMQKPDEKPPTPLLAMDPNALQLVWASCTFGAKAALACTCRELRQKSQAWHWGILPSQQWRQVALHWWLGHKKLAHWDEQFVVQTPVSMQRQGDYEAAAKVQAAWEPGKGKWYRCKGMPGVKPAGCHLPLQCTELGLGEALSADAGLCAGVRSGSLLLKPCLCAVMCDCPRAYSVPALRPADIGYNPVSGKATRFVGWDLWSMHDHPTYVLIYGATSSPMLLYRLRCLFPSCEVEEAEAYKAVWDVSLRHKRTNCRADFGEHKGAAFAHADPSMEKDEAAAQDLLDLIELLCSDRCPHPYDGLVAGCVA